MTKVHDRVVGWPAEVPRNFDANGAPLAEPAPYSASEAKIEIRRRVMLIRPLDFIPLTFAIGPD